MTASLSEAAKEVAARASNAVVVRVSSFFIGFSLGERALDRVQQIRSILFSFFFENPTDLFRLNRHHRNKHDPVPRHNRFKFLGEHSQVFLAPKVANPPRSIDSKLGPAHLNSG